MHNVQKMIWSWYLSSRKEKKVILSGGESIFFSIYIWSFTSHLWLMNFRNRVLLTKICIGKSKYFYLVMVCKRFFGHQTWSQSKVENRENVLRFYSKNILISFFIWFRRISRFFTIFTYKKFHFEMHTTLLVLTLRIRSVFTLLIVNSLS